MTPEQLAELEAAATAAAKTAEDAGGTDETLNAAAESARQAFETAKAPPQDPVKAELDRVQGKKVFTEAEKAAFTLKKNAERAKELGLNPAEILGVTSPAPVAEDDNAPVTVGMLKKRDAEVAQKTALQLADEIADPHVRELTKHHLTESIRPSGNPQEDMRKALAIVSTVKNGQILEELGRKTIPGGPTGAGGPAKSPTDQFVPTADEAALMHSFKLTQKDILAARAKMAQAQ